MVNQLDVEIVSSFCHENAAIQFLLNVSLDIGAFVSTEQIPETVLLG